MDRITIRPRSKNGMQHLLAKCCGALGFRIEFQSRSLFPLPPPLCMNSCRWLLPLCCVLFHFVWTPNRISIRFALCITLFEYVARCAPSSNRIWPTTSSLSSAFRPAPRHQEYVSFVSTRMECQSATGPESFVRRRRRRAHNITRGSCSSIRSWSDMFEYWIGNTTFHENKFLARTGWVWIYNSKWLHCQVLHIFISCLIQWPGHHHRRLLPVPCHAIVSGKMLSW